MQPNRSCHSIVRSRLVMIMTIADEHRQNSEVICVSNRERSAARLPTIIHCLVKCTALSKSYKNTIITLFSLNKLNNHICVTYRRCWIGRSIACTIITINRARGIIHKQQMRLVRFKWWAHTHIIDRTRIRLARKTANTKTQRGGIPSRRANVHQHRG